jgi:predicted nucleotidyltransferase
MLNNSLEGLPEQVNKVLNAYFDWIDLKLPRLLEAYYLYGSIALGAFTDGKSDIDFIAITRRKVTAGELLILKELHSDLQKRFSLAILDGKYISMDDLAHLNEEVKPYHLFNEGKYRGIRLFDKNSIDAYQLQKYGIAIKGDVTFNYSIDWEKLRASMLDNLNSYWVNWRNSQKKLLSTGYVGLFISLKLIEWGVSGVARQFYTFREHGMTSKLGSCEYALNNVPERWHQIIRESMRLRQGVRESYYQSLIKRRNDTLAFMDYLILECNHLFIAK